MNTYSDASACLQRAFQTICVASNAALLLLPALCASVASAQNAALLEEVVVTAELRDTPLLEQATSSSVITAQTIRKRAAVHLENLLSVTPNVNLSGGSSRARFYQIRGIGERSQFVEPLNPSVGLLIDDIDFSGLGTVASLYDIEQVEVLRGPQGTLHGANALAGLINLRSAAPETEFSAKAQATVGEYGRREVGASITGPLIEETLLGRLAVFQHKSDGFIDNTFLSRDDTNQRDESVIRARLRWIAGESQTADINLTHADVDNGYDAFSLDNTRQTLSDEPGRDAQESTALGLRFAQQFDRFSTEFLASAANSDSEYSYDEDWSFVGIAPGLEYSSFDQYLRERDSYSLQLRFASLDPIVTQAGSLDWTAGVYSLRDEESLRRRYTFLATDFTSQFDVDSLAAYGQIDLAIDTQWTLTAGLRLANRSMSYRDSFDVRSDPEDTLWGGKLALQYEHDSLGMFYSSISRGYRAGGVNASIQAFPPGDSNAPEDLRQRGFFDEELLYNIEVGHKGVFADGRLRSAAALFYMDRSDQQVRGSLAIPRGDGSTAFVDFTDNAASGYNFGLEWELLFALNDKIDTYLNIGLLRAKFDDYINADGRDLDGREQAHAPSYQFSTGITVRPWERWELDVQWEGRDAFYFSDRHDERSTSYALLHARAQYRQDSWSLSLWGRNLSDKDYFIRGFGSFGNDPRKGYVTEEYLQYGEPRQIGATLELFF